MRTWNDPLLDLPLDIRVASDRISHLWIMATREQKAKARHDYEACQRMGLEPRFEFTEDFREAGKLRDGIIEILKAYDEGRTRHLQFLKSELMRLHRIMLPNPIIVERKPKDGCRLGYREGCREGCRLGYRQGCLEANDYMEDNPSSPPETPSRPQTHSDNELLTEIRDLLKSIEKRLAESKML